MKRSWRKLIRRLHPEGIPWPGTTLYNLLSRSKVFRKNYHILVEDIRAYFSEGRILDVGTGPGWLLIELHRACPELRLMGLDVSPAMVAKARRNMALAGLTERIPVVEGQAGRIPFGDAEFDAVISTGALHHWKKPVAGLDEVHRVLKPGGMALIYDIVNDTPHDVREEVRRRFGPFSWTLIWLHAFEEPFYSTEELMRLADRSAFGQGQISFVGALCCLRMHKLDPGLGMEGMTN